MAKTPTWQRAEGKNPEGGLNEKGRASLRAAGHDIKRPQPEGGARKRSFCARMEGMKRENTSAETANDPNSRINKSLRKWKCADGGAVDERPHEFVQEQLRSGEPQVAQYNPEAGMETAKEAGRMLAGVTTPGAIADAAGYLGGPSALQNVREGNYGTAALQLAGAVPGIGPFAKAARIAEEARGVEDIYRAVQKAADISEKLRLERAKELGFNISSPYYHATRYDFNEFVPSKWRGATYLADTPEGAMRGWGAGGAEHPALGGPAGSGKLSGPNIMPVYIKGKVWGKDPMPEEWFPEKLTYGEWRDIVEGKNKLNIEGFTPEELGVLNWKRQVGFERSHENGRQFDTYVPDLPEEEYKNFPAEREREMPLRRDRIPIGEAHGWEGTEGPEGKKYRDFFTKIGYPSWVVNDEAGRSIAVSDPKNIRSIFATFDPKMSEGTDIRYSNGGAVDPYDAVQHAAKGGEVWDKPRPKKLGKPEPLSSKEKKSAKAAAKAAGRPYPNLIDNMRAARADGGQVDDRAHEFVQEQLRSGEPQVPQYVAENDFPARTARGVEAADTAASKVNNLLANVAGQPAMRSPEGRTASEVVQSAMPVDPYQAVQQAAMQWREGDKLGAAETMAAGMPMQGAMRSINPETKALLEGLKKQRPEALKRARQMGFDTRTVVFHGTDQPIEHFNPNVYVAKDPSIAEGYARKREYEPVQYDLFKPNPAPNIIPMFVKKGSLELTNPLAKYYKVFDPSHLRSVFAEFNPEYAESSDLLRADGGQVEGDVQFADDDPYAKVQEAAKLPMMARDDFAMRMPQPEVRYDTGPQPGEATLKGYDPTIKERIYQGIAGTEERPSPERAQFARGMSQMAEFAPVLGNVMAGQEAQRRGDTKGMLMAALPVPGMATEARMAEAAISPAEQAAREAYQRVLNAQGLYSHAAEAAYNLPQAKGSYEQMMAMLQKAGVKPEEMRWSGVEQFAGQPVTREQLASHFEQNVPKIEEAIYTAEDPRSAMYRYGSGTQIAIPGGENYREVLLGLPETKGESRYRVYFPNGRSVTLDREHQANALAEMYPGSRVEERPQASQTDYRSSHWDQPNVLGHLRMSDRTGPEGEKILHLEELQSDWGQKGREKGFRNEENLKLKNDISDQIHEMKRNLLSKSNQLTDDWANKRISVEEMNAANQALYADYNPKIKALQEKYDSIPRSGDLPSAPYVEKTQNWVDLGLKRALKEAAEGGYSKMVWTPGEEQAARYDLSKHIDDLTYLPSENRLIGRKNGEDVFYKEVMPKDLDNYVGKDIASKLLETKPISGVHRLSGQELTIGGEGMKGFYDKIVPTRLKELLKKIDPQAKMSFTDLQTKDGMIKVPTLEITPKIREAVKRGLPAYAKGGEVVNKDDPYDNIRLKAKNFPRTRRASH